MRWLLLSLTIAACGGEPRAPDASSPTDAASDAGPTADAGPDAGASPWRVEPALPVAIQEIAVEAHDGRIWVAGGFVRGAVVSTVHVFDPATGAWTEGPPLPAPRHHMSLVSHGGDLYALGGMETTAFAPLDTAWALRAGADAWAPIASLPVDRGAAAADSVGDLIVMVGGNESRGGLAQRTLVYDPAADAWDFGAPIPTEREHLAAVGADGQLLVLAGRRNSLSTNRTELEIYDPVADTWRSGPPLPTPRGGFDAALLDGVIYAVGGEQPDRALDSVDAFELASETWSAAPPVPTPRHGHGVVALDGRVWVVGGADRPIFAAVDAVESFSP
ncbi:MAG: kelch repeat-containing protein [Myxococcota bacterium]|nr:kelch repeat-containing protein [Myxococcota bacterium]